MDHKPLPYRAFPRPTPANMAMAQAISFLPSIESRPTIERLHAGLRALDSGAPHAR